MKAWYSMMVLSLALMGLNGCTPTRVSDRMPPLVVPERWQNASDAQPVSTPKDLSQWWKGFGDPMLNDLIDHALATNHDLRLAKARVREAKAMVTVAESALYPSVDLFAFGGREKRIDRVIGVPGPQGIELITPTADVVTGGLAARWEIDVFGSRHLEAEAAVAQSAGTEEAQRAVQVGLLAQVATNYLELRGIQQRTNILLENIEVQRERLRAVQTFYKAGLVNDMDVARQETLLHSTVGTLPVLTSTAKNLIHRLSVLLGETPASLEERLTHSMPLPVTLPSIPRLLPSSLLEQRPDLRLAQTEVSAAAASLGAARADLFPKFVLSASGGVGALAVGGFPESGRECVCAWVGSHGADIQCWSHQSSYHWRRMRGSITSRPTMRRPFFSPWRTRKTPTSRIPRPWSAAISWSGPRRRRSDPTPTPKPSTNAELWTSCRYSTLSGQGFQPATSAPRPRPRCA